MCYNIIGDLFMKKIKYLLFFIILFSLFIIKSNDSYKVQYKDINDFDELTYTNLYEEYNNKNIKAFLRLENNIIPIVQGNDNEFYLNHDINDNENYKGYVYLDYRNNIKKDKKLIIYGHSDYNNEVPFTVLNDKNFYENNKKFYLYTEYKDYELEIFSTYIEKNDYTYMNLENFNDKTYKEHLEYLKNKSEINYDIDINENKLVVILQTCDMNNTAFRLVMGIEKDHT